MFKTVFHSHFICEKQHSFHISSVQNIFNLYLICDKKQQHSIHTWFKHILLARTVDIIKQMLTILKLQGLEWKQHAYRIPFLITNNIL